MGTTATVSIERLFYCYKLSFSAIFLRVSTSVTVLEHLALSKLRINIVRADSSVQMRIICITVNIYLHILVSESN